MAPKKKAAKASAETKKTKGSAKTKKTAAKASAKTKPVQTKPETRKITVKRATGPEVYVTKKTWPTNFVGRHGVQWRLVSITEHWEFIPANKE